MLQVKLLHAKNLARIGDILKMKTIMLCFNQAGIGGVETAALNQTIQLARMGYRVVIVAKDGIYRKKFEEQGEIFEEFEYVMDKKDYHKKYIAGFYTFLNYITQYLSGGVEMRQALIEVEKLIPEDNVIKPKLKDAISRNAITGFDGDSYIAALQELNKGLDYSEINTFISTARRSETNGDAISETLLDQINDIYKRVEIEKRGHIAGYESKFGVMIVLFGMLSCLAMFCISIFASAILSLGAI